MFFPDPANLRTPLRTVVSGDFNLVVAAAAASDATVADIDDDTLMIRARDGDTRAFDALVRRYQRAALRAAFRFFGSRAEAQDAAQKAFYEVYRARHTYEPRGKFRAFLFRVLHNQCLMAARHLKARERRESQTDVDDAATHELLRPDGARERADRAALVDRALRALSDALREVVVMHYFGDVSYADIAAELGIPLGTVKSRMADAKKQMQQALEEGRP